VLSKERVKALLDNERELLGEALEPFIGATHKHGRPATADDIEHIVATINDLDDIPEADDDPGVNFTYGYAMALLHVLEDFEPAR